MTGKDVEKMLKKAGFEPAGSTGSHKHYKLFGRGKRVTVADHGKKTIAPGTLSAMKRQVTEAIENEFR